MTYQISRIQYHKIPYVKSIIQDALNPLITPEVLINEIYEYVGMMEIHDVYTRSGPNGSIERYIAWYGWLSTGSITRKGSAFVWLFDPGHIIRAKQHDWGVAKIHCMIGTYDYPLKEPRKTYRLSCFLGLQQLVQCMCQDLKHGHFSRCQSWSVAKYAKEYVDELIIVMCHIFMHTYEKDVTETNTVK